MKPQNQRFVAMASTTAVVLTALATVPGHADIRSMGVFPSQEASSSPLIPDGTALASLPSQERVWVKVRTPVAVEELASSLSLDETRLARLNEVDEDHEFHSGDWLVLPSQSSRKAKLLASIDTSELRRSPPFEAPPEPGDSGIVRLGDSLVKIAQRYNLTLAELLRLNPGLETARLVVGSQIRLVQASESRSRMVLGLNPTGSGGLSWPQLPGFGGGGAGGSRQWPGFDNGTWIWPTQGVFSSGYGWRWGRMHKGIDLANNVGTPIHAARSGEVIAAGWNDGGYGYLVELRHPDGSMTRYGHNSRILVRVGDQVSQGQVISEMGSTGRSTGPHLHFEIHPAGQGAMNPLQFLPARA